MLTLYKPRYRRGQSRGQAVSEARLYRGIQDSRNHLAAQGAVRTRLFCREAAGLPLSVRRLILLALFLDEC